MLDVSRPCVTVTLPAAREVCSSDKVLTRKAADHPKAKEIYDAASRRIIGFPAGLRIILAWPTVSLDPRRSRQ
jgi:hypothetical protein